MGSPAPVRAANAPTRRCPGAVREQNHLSVREPVGRSRTQHAEHEVAQLRGDLLPSGQCQRQVAVADPACRHGVRGARRRAQVVLQHQHLAVGAAHDVEAGDVRPCQARISKQVRLEQGSVHQPRRHHVSVDDALLPVEVRPDSSRARGHAARGLLAAMPTPLLRAHGEQRRSGTRSSACPLRTARPRAPASACYRRCERRKVTAEQRLPPAPASVRAGIRLPGKPRQSPDELASSGRHGTRLHRCAHPLGVSRVAAPESVSPHGPIQAEADTALRSSTWTKCRSPRAELPTGVT